MKLKYWAVLFIKALNWRSQKNDSPLSVMSLQQICLYHLEVYSEMLLVFSKT